MTLPPSSSALHVVAGAILAGDRVLVAQRGAAMREPLLWEFPGGKVEVGETATGALERELREELGVGIHRVERLGEATSVGVRLELFACEIICGEAQAVEHASLLWLRADELYDLTWAPADVPLLKLVTNRLKLAGGAA